MTFAPSVRHWLAILGIYAAWNGATLAARPDLVASPAYDLVYTIAPPTAWAALMLTTAATATLALTLDQRHHTLARHAAYIALAGSFTYSTWWGAAIAEAVIDGRSSAATAPPQWWLVGLVVLYVFRQPSLSVPTDQPPSREGDP